MIKPAADMEERRGLPLISEEDKENKEVGEEESEEEEKV